MKKADNHEDKCYFKDCENASEWSNYFMDDVFVHEKIWVHVCDTCRNQIEQGRRWKYVPATIIPLVDRGLEWEVVEPQQLGLFEEQNGI